MGAQNGRVAFTLERRERFLALISVGVSIEAACASAGTSRTTVHRWLATGRAADADAEHRSFAERFDQLAIDRDQAAELVARDEEESLIDAMTFLEAERMAELTEEQRQRARELFVAELDTDPPAGLDWERERRLILRGERDPEPDT
jgi:hypothetical protein